MANAVYVFSFEPYSSQLTTPTLAIKNHLDCIHQPIIQEQWKRTINCTGFWGGRRWEGWWNFKKVYMEGGMNSGSEWEAVFEMWLQDGEGANEPGTFPKELSAGQPESDVSGGGPDQTIRHNPILVGVTKAVFNSSPFQIQTGCMCCAGRALLILLLI